MATAIPTQKACPRCGRRWLLSTPVCQGCGHVFRTQYRVVGGGAPPGGHPGYGFHVPPPPPPAAPPQHPAPAPYETVRPHGGAHLLIVIFLALIFPWAGFGQLYNGQFGKAFVIWASQFVVLMAVFIFSGMALGSDGSPFAGIGGSLLFLEVFILPVVWVLDAISVALHVSHGIHVSEWQWF